MIDELQVRLTRFLRRLLTRPRIDLPLAFGLLLLIGVVLLSRGVRFGGATRA